MQATITHDLELNGNQSISFSVLPTKINKPFIDDISEMWEFIDTNEVVHKIIYAKKKGEGTLLNVDIMAVPLFFDTMDNERIYEEYNEHMTAMSAFTKIFEDMPFGFVLSDVFDAVEWEGFGAGESRLETFKRALDRYKAEFRIVGNTVYLKRQIGRDTSFMYRYKLNTSNIVKEIDANEYWTYAKGYGNYGNEGEGDGESSDWQDAKLFREYTSPLAKILGIRHAPPIKDGRISIASRMDSGLKALVDDSLKISITTDIHDLRRQGYALAQPELGDRVFVIDERIGLDEEVRVIDVSVTKDWRGNVLDLKLTIGSESLTKRHQSNMSTAVDRINELVEGRRKLPFSVLDDAVRNATKALQNAQTELSFGTNGILAVDKRNPNLLTLLNSAGIGISNDGGNSFRTAMTGDGIVADVITAGVLNADQVALIGGSGRNFIHITGDKLELEGSFQRTWRGTTTTSNVKTRMQKGHLRFRDEDKSESLYMSHFGLSTFVDGEGEYQEAAGSSGTIEWWDRTYSPSNAKGITMSSYSGVVALRSDNSHVTVDSQQSVDIYSRNSVVYVTPKSGLSGNSNFWFNRLDSTDDGFFMFGSRETSSNVGLRFYKSGGETIAVVDRNYNRGGDTKFDVGKVAANDVVKRDGSYSVYWNGTSGGSTSTSGSSNTLRASGIRALSGSSDIFLATNDGAVRVTSSLGNNNGGSINYKPLACDYVYEYSNDTVSAGAFSLMSARPENNESTNIINSIDLLRSTKEGSPVFDVVGDSPISHVDGDQTGKDIGSAIMFALKALQEQSGRLDRLEGAI